MLTAWPEGGDCVGKRVCLHLKPPNPVSKLVFVLQTTRAWTSWGCCSWEALSEIIILLFNLEISVIEIKKKKKITSDPKQREQHTFPSSVQTLGIVGRNMFGSKDSSFMYFFEGSSPVGRNRVVNKKIYLWMSLCGKRGPVNTGCLCWFVAFIFSCLSWGFWFCILLQSSKTNMCYQRF